MACTTTKTTRTRTRKAAAPAARSLRGAKGRFAVIMVIII